MLIYIDCVMQPRCQHVVARGVQGCMWRASAPTDMLFAIATPVPGAFDDFWHGFCSHSPPKISKNRKLNVNGIKKAMQNNNGWEGLTFFC